MMYNNFINLSVSHYFLPWFALANLNASQSDEKTGVPFGLDGVPEDVLLKLSLLWLRLACF